MSNTTALQMKLDTLVDQREEAKRRSDSAASSARFANIAFLVGIIGLFFYGAGILILIFAIPVALIQGSKKRAAERDIKRLTKEIDDIRQQIASATD